MRLLSRHQRVADLVIGHDPLFARRQYGVFALVARDDHIDGFRQILLRDDAAVALDGAQRGLVDEVRELRARSAGRGARDGLIVDVVVHHHVLGVDAQNVLAALQIRQLDRYAPVKTARTQQSFIERFRSVRRGEDDDAR